jgi:hypothetical protein
MRWITGLALCVLFLCGCTDNSGKTDPTKRNDPPGVSAPGKGIKAEQKGITPD